MKKYKRISVITPVYNREDLLEETIDSILNQNYPNLEYIVIDDGSTDKSLNKLKKYKRKIKLVSQKNIGETKTVNKGLSMATGDIIGVVNSDDPLIPNSLFEIAKFFEKNPNILVAYPDWKLIDEKGKTLDKISVHEHDYKYMFSSQHCYIGPGAFFTKKGLKAVKARSTEFKYVSDFEFWLRLGLFGQFKKIPKTLATFRVHSQGQSNYAKGSKMAKENIDLVTHTLNLKNFPKDLRSERSKAYSSAFFLAGGKSKSYTEKYIFYSKSLISDPVMFSKKMKYELIKLKHRFLV